MWRISETPFANENWKLQLTETMILSFLVWQACLFSGNLFPMQQHYIFLRAGKLLYVLRGCIGAGRFWVKSSLLCCRWTWNAHLGNVTTLSCLHLTVNAALDILWDCDAVTRPPLSVGPKNRNTLQHSQIESRKMARGKPRECQLAWGIAFKTSCQISWMHFTFLGRQGSEQLYPTWYFSGNFIRFRKN